MKQTNHLHDNMYTNPKMYTQIMTRAQYQETLNATNGEIIALGQMWLITGKSAGAGMYRVSVKPKVY